jgi:hypothetical protein
MYYIKGCPVYGGDCVVYASIHVMKGGIIVLELTPFVL